jgi:ATP-dependent RNA helicase DeaD
MTNFKDLHLLPEIQRALDELGFTEPTEIQKKAIPLLLAAPKVDFHGQAQTGTGKTLAFGLPLLQKIDASKHATQALVVAPTRELAIQIAESISAAAKYLRIKIAVIYGGASMEEQIRQLKQGAQIVVGTPGRLNDHLRRKTLQLAQVKTLVLDEADIMLDMGFKEEVDEILKYAPVDREIWLFSATVKTGIKQLMDAHMKETVSVRISKTAVGTGKTKQYFCVVPFRARLGALARFIESTPDFYGFIFCQTKMLTGEIAEQLLKRGYNVGALHGDMSQAQRNAVIKRFKSQDLSIVVATDVAARGIDVSDLTHVINYSIPEDLESYVHRIGRTGRAGKEGTAITFINKTEVRSIQFIQRKFQVVIDPIDIPTVEHIVKVRLKSAAQYITDLENAQPLPYFKQVQELLAKTPESSLRLITAHAIYDKFLKTIDMEEVPYTHLDKVDSEQQLQEVCLSVGTDDGISQEDVREFILATKAIQENQIQSIRVIKRRSFIKLSGDCSPELMNALRGLSLGGRKVHANLTCVVADGGGHGRSRDGRSGRGGDYQRSRRSNSDNSGDHKRYGNRSRSR